jgi:hypothetical protein
MSNSYILGALRALLCRELIFGCPTRVVTFAFHERVISLNQPGMLAIKKAEAPRQEPHSTLGLNRVCRGVGTCENASFVFSWGLVPLGARRRQRRGPSARCGVAPTGRGHQCRPQYMCLKHILAWFGHRNPDTYTGGT